MRARHRFDRTLTSLCATLVLALATLAPLPSSARAAAPVEMQPDGALRIAGRIVQCGRARNVLDPDMPNLGMASRRRNEVILNPLRLSRYPGTVRLFVFHHECGHHHVGGDELEADCWAVNRGLREGWLDRRHLGPICSSFGSRRGSPTHPAGDERCASLYRCFAEASAFGRTARLPLSPEAPAQRERRPLQAASSPARIDAPPLPVATLLFVFVALLSAAAPRRRGSHSASA